MFKKTRSGSRFYAHPQGTKDTDQARDASIKEFVENAVKQSNHFVEASLSFSSFDKP